MLNAARAPRPGILRIAGVIALAALLAVTVAVLTSSRADGEIGPDPMAGLIGDGARVVIAADAVAPAARPPSLTLIMPTSRVSGDDRETRIGTETSYQAGGLDVMVCDYRSQGAGASQSSCAIEERQLVRDEVIGTRHVQVAVDADWNVPTNTAEVPDGDRIAEVLWWWTSVPLTGSTPAWLAQAAEVPGPGMFG